MDDAPRSSARDSLLVVVIRALLVALAAVGVVAAIAVSRGREPGDAANNVHRYACPMHSEVTASTPGDCPICGMALEEVDAASRAAMLREAAQDAAEQVPFTALRTSGEAQRLLRFAVAPARRFGMPGEIHAPAVAGADGRIVAQLYRDELATLEPDEVAAFVPAAAPRAAPEAGINVRRDGAPPELHGATASVAFRVAPGGTGGAVPPGQVGWIKLAYKVRATLVVRSAGVLYDADGPYVLTFSAQRGELARRRIEIGKDYGGMTAVVSGLRDKEFVIMADAFSLDAERRLQAGR